MEVVAVGLFGAGLVFFGLGALGWRKLRTLIEQIGALEARVVTQAATIEKLVAVAVGDSPKLLLGDGTSEPKTPPPVDWFAVAALKKTIRRAGDREKFGTFMAGFPIWENLTFVEMGPLFALLPPYKMDDAVKAYHVRQDHKQREQEKERPVV